MLESASSAVSDNSTKRSTSFAKTVNDLVHEESALDRARALKEQFDRAKTAHEHAPEKEKTHRDRGTAGASEAPLPEPHLRPGGSVQRSMDRAVSDENRTRTYKRAKQLKQQLEDHQQRHKPGLANDFDRTR